MTRQLALSPPGLGAEVEDETLAAAAVAGPDVFAELYARYLPRVYRYLRTRAESGEEASDLTQVVFLRAFAGLPSYRPARTPFAAWLFRIARNTAVDAHRRRKATVSWDLMPEPLIDGDAPGSPEASLEQRERALLLRAIVARLGDDKRELLALRYAADLSSREIAALLGKSESAVKKMLTRTLSVLKEQYRD